MRKSLSAARRRQCRDRADRAAPPRATRGTPTPIFLRARPDPAADTPTNMTELGGLPGAPPPPALPGVKTAPAMGVGDTVLLEMNGDKWAFIKLKRDGCVPRPTASIAPRRDVHHPGPRASASPSVPARRPAAAAASSSR